MGGSAATLEPPVRQAAVNPLARSTESQAAMMARLQAIALEESQAKLPPLPPPSIKRPFFSVSLAIILVVYMIFFLAFNGIAPLDQNWMIGPANVTAFVAWGAKVTPLIVEFGQWWRLFSPIVMHGGIVHLLINLVFLCTVTIQLERLWRWWRTMVVFVASAVGSFCFSALLNPRTISYGASGGLAGTLGAVLVELFRLRNEIDNARRWMLVESVEVLLFVLFGLAPGVDNWSHISGLVLGVLAGFSVGPRRHQGRPYRIAGISCYFLLVAVALVLLYTSALGDCMYCCFVNPWSVLPPCFSQ